MEGEDMRAVVLTLDQGQNVPWHYHSTITDSFVCLQSPWWRRARHETPMY
jgi:quercetin dioxygenase-like cupin family protein